MKSLHFFENHPDVRYDEKSILGKIYQGVDSSKIYQGDVSILLIMVIRMVSNMRVIFVQYHMASDTDGELVLLPADFARTRGAHCLDGSAPHACLIPFLSP
jgi:hypothetical protein